MSGSVALITGGARGQGRAHAVRLAEEGADVVVVDVCAPIDSAPYPMPDPTELAQTVKAVEAVGRRALAVQADVRDLAALEKAVAETVAQFGRLDVVVANAGIGSFAPALSLDAGTWQEMIDINLTGAFHTVRAAAPAIIDGGRGGSIVLTSSVAGLIGFPNLAHYCAAKHGLVGLMKVLAIEFAPHRIRVNTVHSTNVDTDMIQNPAMYELFSGGVPGADRATAAASMQGMHALPISWVEPADIANAVAWLASDEARRVTGVALPVDGGMTAPYKIPHG
nr:mycofactocin-coupled SDR family oxidoreductase [Actinomycetospora corticicola]